MVKNLQRQSGVFIVELALVMLVIFLFIAFTSEIIARQAIHGALQNLSFSGVSIIKERTQLYDSSTKISHDQADQLFVLLSKSMSRSFAGFDNSAFGMTLEQVLFEEKNIQKPSLAIFKKGLSCPRGRLLVREEQLFFLTERANPAPLYRVTLCYRGDDGQSLTKEFAGKRHLSSSSIMIGR
ncbi:tight adherence pilus pseudopilin TadF [Parendozoicomonas sp. Alg238-R29]|uniref:tight adherence pilus pseudopilin TadF n=1 Tax=Parendozoicomonas sp. Alg238-R29 TaxID=2993446 RepID=UPI00248D4147|nr:tight adherence pilus pseudopilin TadF [Parendozoicomonas sp. Alg238-R29]